MSVYFEKKLNIGLGNACTDIAWCEDKFLAASCLSQDEGGHVSIYDNQGCEVKKLQPTKSTTHVTSLCWHPRGSLVASWENLLFTWHTDDPELNPIESPHRSTIKLLAFSSQGSRLISADEDGGLVGWNSSSRQLVTAFHHQLTDPVSHVVFRNPTKGLDIRGAAKAAVAGDEQALDLFTNLDMFSWRPKTAGRRPIVYSDDFRDGMSFYTAAQTGVIFYVSESGRCEEMFDLNCPCQDMLFRSEKDQLLVLTETLAVVVFSITHEGALHEYLKVKLSGDPREILPNMIWTTSDTIAINTGGSSIRLWNIDHGDNVVLPLPESAPNAEHFSSLACSLLTGKLCCGTNAGNLLIWSKNVEGEWTLCNEPRIGTPIKNLAWGQELLAVNTLSNLYVLKEHPLSTDFYQKYGCIQITGHTFLILVFQHFDQIMRYEVAAEIQIQGITISEKYCLIFSDKIAVVYQFTIENSNNLTVQSAGNFACECEDAAIYDETLVILEAKRVTLRTIQGVVKQILFLVPTEGDPIVLGVFRHFTVVVTSIGIVRLWDISRREAKSHGKVKDLRDLVERFGEVISISCNSDGSKIGFILALNDFVPDAKFYVLDVESDILQWLDFSNGESSSQEENYVQDIRDSAILKFAWDEEEPKLVSVHLKTPDNSMLVFLWVSSEKGILIHEKITMTKTQTGLLYCQAPYAVSLSTKPATFFEHVAMGDFSGVSEINASTKSAILTFSYNLAVGNMDAAFKAISSVSSEKVWMNLARNCVKTRRLDVAQICMGRMKNARIARALREAIEEPELEARVAILAIHVNMLDEAIELLKSCKRYDLLNKLYQTMSEWDKALEVAEKFDRVNLRNTHHLYGKFLEQSGQVDQALEHFEKADTHRIHGPMLLLNDPEKLKIFVDSSGDALLFKWMAQNMESTGDMQSALHYYRQAKDFCSIIRVLCFLNEFDEAIAVVESSSDRAASYHLARQFEALERIDDALVFFEKAGAYGNAVRICKEQGMMDKIWMYALQGSEREQTEVAAFLYDMGDTHKSALLYQKAGLTSKALEIAFRHDDFEALEIISRDLTARMDPILLDKLANFFITHEQFGRAVDILAAAEKFSDAVALCKSHSVQLTEEMAEKLNPTGDNSKQLLIEIADCALIQGNYYLAAQKFTQAGEKALAMKALLKSGDTDKIIYLAGVCRDKEVYVMAGNYLQALDWRQNPQLLNTIIQFYTKAKAFQTLANFYVACATVEVEEFEDFDKSIVALEEAKKCFERLPEDGMSRRAVDATDKRISTIRQFVKLQKAFENNETDANTSARSLLMHITDSNGPITKGLVYALMIRHETNITNQRQLYEEMKKNVADPLSYLPTSIASSLGLTKKVDEDNSDPDTEYEIREAL